MFSKDSRSVVIFSLASVVAELFCDFSLNKSCKEQSEPMQPLVINFINMFKRVFFTWKTKMLLAFSNKKCAGCAIRKSHLAVQVVLVAIHKSQLPVCKKVSKKQRIKMSMKLTPGCRKWQLIYPNLLGPRHCTLTFGLLTEEHPTKCQELTTTIRCSLRVRWPVSLTVSLRLRFHTYVALIWYILHPSRLHLRCRSDKTMYWTLE